jgi:two-component system, NtrC family, sensor kinase
MSAPRIYASDGLPEERERLAQTLRGLGEVELFDSALALTHAVSRATPDLIVTHCLVERPAGVPLVLLVADAEEASAPDGADDYLLKPVSARRLSSRAASLLKLRAATLALEARTRELERSHSERRRIELQLGLRQKLEAVGRVAGGVAHEINTPVQFIGDSGHFLREAFGTLLGALERRRRFIEELAPKSVQEALAAQDEQDDLTFICTEVPRSVSRIIDGAGRIATIVRAMKQFSSSDSTAQSLVDLNQAIQSTLTVATNAYKYVATLETDLQELPPVLCNVGQINEVLLNLVCNSAHAVGEAVRGTPGKGIIAVRSWADGESACISVRDTGTGIPEEIRGKVFDPFFTTKDVGQGTGQGLAIAHAVIVDEHQGSLTFESQVGIGTTFTVRIPVHGTVAPAVESDLAHAGASP